MLCLNIVDLKHGDYSISADIMSSYFSNELWVLPAQKSPGQIKAREKIDKLTHFSLQ
jgi:hypothetical protein